MRTPLRYVDALCLCYNRLKLYITKKLDSMGYILAVGLALVNLTQLAPKSAVLCEISSTDGHY